MSDDTTPRLQLPQLQPGQAQKELYHNEALALLDMAVQPVVQAVGLDTPPAAPMTGACWIVGTAATAAWFGRANAIAGWTGGGWRFLAAFEGMTAWSLADSVPVRFAAGQWLIGAVAARALVIADERVVGVRLSAIPAAAGGAVIDSEARATIAAVLAALRTHGLIDL